MTNIGMVTIISAGLKQVDQFRELALQARGQNPSPPGARIEQEGTALQVRYAGTPGFGVEAAQLHMDQFDAVRFDALRKRIAMQWNTYNDRFVEDASAAPDKRGEIQAELRTLEGELCRDFKEMVSIYERTMGMSLPDHYQLYEICQ